MPTQLRPGCWLIELTGVNAYLVEDVVGETTTGGRLSIHDDPIAVDLSNGERGPTASATEHDTDSENGDDEHGAETTTSDGTATDETATDATETDDRPVLTLVDTGMPSDAATLERDIEATGHTLADVERVLITHYDVDHVGGLSRLDLPNATVYMGSPDADYLTGRKQPPLDGHKGALQRLSSLFVSADVDVAVVDDGDRVGSFTVYETPGHTAGHVAYVSSDLSVAFVGDLVRESDGDLQASPWFISHDTAAVVDSIHDLADREPAVEVLGMGHGVPFLRGGSVRLAKLGQNVE